MIASGCGGDPGADPLDAGSSARDAGPALTWHRLGSVAGCPVFRASGPARVDPLVFADCTLPGDLDAAGISSCREPLPPPPGMDRGAILLPGPLPPLRVAARPFLFEVLGTGPQDERWIAVGDLARERTAAVLRVCATTEVVPTALGLALTGPGEVMALDDALEVVRVYATPGRQGVRFAVSQDGLAYDDGSGIVVLPADAPVGTGRRTEPVPAIAGLRIVGPGPTVLAWTRDFGTPRPNRIVLVPPGRPLEVLRQQGTRVVHDLEWAEDGVVVLEDAADGAPRLRFVDDLAALGELASVDDRAVSLTDVWRSGPVVVAPREREPPLLLAVDGTDPTGFVPLREPAIRGRRLTWPLSMTPQAMAYLAGSPRGDTLLSVTFHAEPP